VQPVLEQLFALYPQLFGAEFLPLKRGIFQELLEKHPDVFQRDSLKAALALHARSTRYLQCVAAGKARHDLLGAAVEDVAPEHVFQALVELFRRRQARTQDDLRPRLRAQFAAAFEASGLSRADYLARVLPADEAMAALLDEALNESAQKIARQEALLKAFEASGKTVREFADMYGLPERDVSAALARRKRVQANQAKAAGAAPT
jgi:sRNA-binding protein